MKSVNREAIDAHNEMTALRMELENLRNLTTDFARK